MRTVGPYKPTDSFRSVPDTLAVAVITTAGAVVAQDYPTGAQLMHFNVSARTYFNEGSTKATVPSTNSSGSTLSSDQNIMLNTAHQEFYYIPSDSTGYSVTSATSGIISIEFWKQGS